MKLALACVAVCLVAAFALAQDKSKHIQHSIIIDGDWQLVEMRADGSTLPALKGNVTIKDGDVKFNLSQPSQMEKLQFHLEFVDGGLEVLYKPAPGVELGPYKGTWTSDPETFNFCFVTEDDDGKPSFQNDRAGVIKLKRVRRN